jgi:UMF1 family MFS transporter
MLITGIYFVIGLAILMSIDVRRGREAALQSDAPPTNAVWTA